MNVILEGVFSVFQVKSKGGVLMEKWKGEGISTAEEVLAMINEKLPQPVGIVIFGADCSLKERVYIECTQRIKNITTGYGSMGNMPLLAAGRPLSRMCNVLTVMDGKMSTEHEQRHQIVTMLRKMGAKSVIGIYTQVPPQTRRLPEISKADVNYNKQAEKLEQEPPTGDGLDCFVICTEEEG